MRDASREIPSRRPATPGFPSHAALGELGFGELLGDRGSSHRTGTLPDASDGSRPSKVKKPFVFYGVPTRAGDRGRTGDVQLGKLGLAIVG
jgi:hypothetical protein